jgi:hypothetical protein
MPRACMHVPKTKTVLYWFDGDPKPLPANGAILRREPGEHVLPII